jgi:hypothetical protein
MAEVAFLVTFSPIFCAALIDLGRTLPGHDLLAPLSLLNQRMGASGTPPNAQCCVVDAAIPSNLTVSARERPRDASGLHLGRFRVILKKLRGSE